VREHPEIDVSDGVYPPSDDTYLLLDAIDFRPEDSVLDVGCGAGLGTVIAASKASSVVGIDISLDAAKNTAANLKKNNRERSAGIVQSDLLSAISIRSRFSIILFNPPYLSADDNSTMMDRAYIGGKLGSELTQRFIGQASRHLIDGGRLFVVASTLADTRTLMKAFRRHGFQVARVAEKSLFFEKIQVLRGIFRGQKETVL
jgi:release factor glutamine methyltransferase